VNKRDAVRQLYGDVAPPGREAQVKTLKGKLGVDNPFAVAWASYNKDGEMGDGDGVFGLPGNHGVSPLGLSKRDGAQRRDDGTTNLETFLQAVGRDVLDAVEDEMPDMADTEEDTDDSVDGAQRIVRTAAHHGAGGHSVSTFGDAEDDDDEVDPPAHDPVTPSCAHGTSTGAIASK
jgi:hypothetical protein